MYVEKTAWEGFRSFVFYTFGVFAQGYLAVIIAVLIFMATQGEFLTLGEGLLLLAYFFIEVSLMALVFAGVVIATLGSAHRFLLDSSYKNYILSRECSMRELFNKTPVGWCLKSPASQRPL